MKVRFLSNVCDQTTEHIAATLQAPFEAIARDLSKDFGGTMEHLWIDFELIERHAQGRPSWPFRFQKRVGGSSPGKLTGLPRDVYENVGHFSVRPDFRELLCIPLESVVGYALRLIYDSTSVLLEKENKLGGFDAIGFRDAFLASCRHHGYKI